MREVCTRLSARVVLLPAAKCPPDIRTPCKPPARTLTFATVTVENNLVQVFYLIQKLLSIRCDKLFRKRNCRTVWNIYDSPFEQQISVVSIPGL